MLAVDEILANRPILVIRNLPPYKSFTFKWLPIGSVQ